MAAPPPDSFDPITLPSDAFICECDTPERHAYLVTDHEGAQSAALYCRGCADLARVNWTGETAALAPLFAVWRNDETDCALCGVAPLVHAGETNPTPRITKMKPTSEYLGHNEVARMLQRRLAKEGIYTLQQGEAQFGSIYLHLYADVYGDVTAPWNPAWKDEYWDRRPATEAGWDDVGPLDKIRISDHRQPRGGGYSMGRGERHGYTEWSIDPSTTLEGFPSRTQQERIDEIVEEAVEALQDAREEA